MNKDILKHQTLRLYRMIGRNFRNEAIKDRLWKLFNKTMEQYSAANKAYLANMTVEKALAYNPKSTVKSMFPVYA